MWFSFQRKNVHNKKKLANFDEIFSIFSALTVRKISALTPKANYLKTFCKSLKLTKS